MALLLPGAVAPRAQGGPGRARRRRRPRGLYQSGTARRAPRAAPTAAPPAQRRKWSPPRQAGSPGPPCGGRGRREISTLRRGLAITATRLCWSCSFPSAGNENWCWGHSSLLPCSSRVRPWLAAAERQLHGCTPPPHPPAPPEVQAAAPELLDAVGGAGVVDHGGQGVEPHAHWPLLFITDGVGVAGKAREEQGQLAGRRPRSRRGRRGLQELPAPEREKEGRRQGGLPQLPSFRQAVWS